MEFFPKAIPEGGRCFASFSHWTKFKQLQTLVELGEQRVTVEFDINLRDWQSKEMSNVPQPLFELFETL